MGFVVAVAAASDEHERFEPGVQRLVGVAAPTEAGESAFVVISTQGSGDRAALKSAAAMHARYRAFVGSRRKAETLKRELALEGVPAEALAAIKAPAGLDISAISSEEIALSILAEMIAARRKLERPPAEDAAG
jgi:xanthine dehydrogenase accessory factor